MYMYIYIYIYIYGLYSFRFGGLGLHIRGRKGLQGHGPIAFRVGSRPLGWPLMSMLEQPPPDTQAFEPPLPNKISSS